MVTCRPNVFFFCKVLLLGISFPSLFPYLPWHKWLTFLESGPVWECSISFPNAHSTSFCPLLGLHSCLLSLPPFPFWGVVLLGRGGMLHIQHHIPSLVQMLFHLILADRWNVFCFRFTSMADTRRSQSKHSLGLKTLHTVLHIEMMGSCW